MNIYCSLSNSFVQYTFTLFGEFLTNQTYQNTAMTRPTYENTGNSNDTVVKEMMAGVKRGSSLCVVSFLFSKCKLNTYSMFNIKYWDLNIRWEKWDESVP